MNIREAKRLLWQPVWFQGAVYTLESCILWRQAEPAPCAKNLITSQDNTYCVGLNGMMLEKTEAASSCWTKITGR